MIRNDISFHLHFYLYVSVWCCTHKPRDSVYCISKISMCENPAFHSKYTKHLLVIDDSSVYMTSFTYKKQLGMHNIHRTDQLLNQ